MNSNPERTHIMETNTATAPATLPETLTAAETATVTEAVANAPVGTATATVTAPTPTPAQPKPPKFVIYKDANGNELKRETLGRGRPPRNSTVDADGNRIVAGVTLATDGSVQLPAVKLVRAEIFYITIDGNGNEVKRELKGRGRPRPGYVKHEKGAFAGHWVGEPKPAPAPATPAAAPAHVAQPAVQTAAQSDAEAAAALDAADAAADAALPESERVTGHMPTLANA